MKRPLYKLIAIDMDGTLLNSNNKILSENLKMIHQAVENGMRISLASGRSTDLEKYNTIIFP